MTNKSKLSFQLHKFEGKTKEKREAAWHSEYIMEGNVHRPKSGANQLLHGLNQSSRIIKASRSSSGKDRCGKILIGKGLKDRKVKLSVAIASRFYDILDRLDYNHPEKDVKWLIRVASDAIYKLPSLPTYSFPDATEQLNLFLCEYEIVRDLLFKDRE
ncbi:hypothetical protein FEM48_Zijuj09G0225000 [Ziziphus jujuba var. spinosa]|uniref:TCP domain-containing protein n=1 Tax=Ziziphus jujuba var. spinosa TaxID=714518 RepID=A0A978UVP4_ZIZJJ|nr:hypothetical protein FEM48_Zijuj09G0225000 [Ziziphus jujuba var. spinosa]